jgi:hypothetical protein
LAPGSATRDYARVGDSNAELGNERCTWQETDST